MNKSSMSNTLKTIMTLRAGLEKGYKFVLQDKKELITTDEIIQADNAYELIYVYKPNGKLAYIQNERKKDE